MEPGLRTPGGQDGTDKGGGLHFWKQFPIAEVLISREERDIGFDRQSQIRERGDNSDNRKKERRGKNNTEATGYYPYELRPHCNIGHHTTLLRHQNARYQNRPKK